MPGLQVPPMLTACGCHSVALLGQLQVPVLGSPSAPGLGSTRLMYQPELLPHSWGWRDKAARLFVRQTRTKVSTLGTYLRRCVFVAMRPHTPS